MDTIALHCDLKDDGEVPLSIIRRTIQNKAENLMDLPDYEKFKRNLDLTSYFLVCKGDKEGSCSSMRSTSISLECKLAACFRFLAEGSYQRGVANDFKVRTSQPTLSQHLASILNLVEAKLCPQWIKLDMNDEEKQAAKRYFYGKSSIPGIVMCVDGTFIKIIRPAENSSPHLFYNRKEFYSMNAMIICDHKQRIRYVNGRHPRASHDSFIWKSSNAARFFENNYRNGNRNTRLLGDGGYPLQSWLLTPCRFPAEGSQESKFNKSHSKARYQVEKTIGVLKSRLCCLLGARQLHYIIQIVNVCSALHNICINYNINDECLEPLVEPTEDNDCSTREELSNTNSYTAEAINIRNEIVRTF